MLEFFVSVTSRLGACVFRVLWQCVVIFVCMPIGSVRTSNTLI